MHNSPVHPSLGPVIRWSIRHHGPNCQPYIQKVPKNVRFCTDPPLFLKTFLPWNRSDLDLEEKIFMSTTFKSFPPKMTQYGKYIITSIPYSSNTIIPSIVMKYDEIDYKSSLIVYPIPIFKTSQ